MELLKKLFFLPLVRLDKQKTPDAVWTSVALWASMEGRKTLVMAVSQLTII